MGKSIKRNKAKERYRRAAAKAPALYRHIATSKAAGEWRTTRRQLGKFGAASEVRRIDPETGEPIGKETPK